MRTILIGIAVLGFVLVAGNAPAAVEMWGVTNGINDKGFWTGGEIFTVNTGTGAVSVKQAYTPTGNGVLAFGDIAVRSNGEVYVTYYGNDGFDKLAKVNTSTWAFDWVQDLGGWNDQVNALDFVGDTLYGVTGGGIPASLQQFALTGSGVTVATLGSLGINSDGDLANHPGDARVFYTSWETGGTSELNTITFSPVGKTGKEIATLNGWSGIEFDPTDLALYAGTYWDQRLYTLDYDTGNATHTATQVFDLSADLGGTITGLSVPEVPEPAAIIVWSLLGLAAAGYGLWRRRAA